MMSKGSWRVFANATLLALVVGVSCGWLVVALNEWSHGIQNPLEGLFIAIVSAGPAVLLSALVAGYLASSAVSASQLWPLSRWIRQGLLGGGVVGGCALSAWFTAISLDVRMSLLTLTLGAVAGAFTGSVIAVYCWRAARA